MKQQACGVLIGFLLLMGCAAAKPREPSPDEVAALKQFQEMKVLWETKQYKTIAEIEATVSCQTSDLLCGGMHLMTGQSCFQLLRYSCAADHFERGIAQTPEKAFDTLGMNRIEVYLHLLESLRFLQDREKEGALLHAAKRLQSAAAPFRVLAPEHPAGPFFWGSAQLILLRADIPTTDDPTRLCQEFSTLLNTVKRAGPPSPSLRNTTYYRQLLSDITLAQQTLPKCGS